MPVPVPTKTDASIGRPKADALPATDLDTQVPAAEYERLKDAVIATAEAANALEDRVDVMESAPAPELQKVTEQGNTITNIDEDVLALFPGEVEGKPVLSLKGQSEIHLAANGSVRGLVDGFGISPGSDKQGSLGWLDEDGGDDHKRWESVATGELLVASEIHEGGGIYRKITDTSPCDLRFEEHHLANVSLSPGVYWAQARAVGYEVDESGSFAFSVWALVDAYDTMSVKGGGEIFKENSANTGVGCTIVLDETGENLSVQLSDSSFMFKGWFAVTLELQKLTVF